MIATSGSRRMPIDATTCGIIAVRRSLRRHAMEVRCPLLSPRHAAARHCADGDAMSDIEVRAPEQPAGVPCIEGRMRRLGWRRTLRCAYRTVIGAYASGGA
jgi:hypothetical protein